MQSKALARRVSWSSVARMGLRLSPRTCISSTISTLKDVTCVGWDGSPIDGAQEENEAGNKVYYDDHKPSPLSEIEFADTRKPISRATDSDAVDDVSGGDKVVFWTKEQIESAEETLLRAEAMFREARERGDPYSPQSRALARYLNQRNKVNHSSSFM